MSLSDRVREAGVQGGSETKKRSLHQVSEHF